MYLHFCGKFTLVFFTTMISCHLQPPQKSHPLHSWPFFIEQNRNGANSFVFPIVRSVPAPFLLLLGGKVPHKKKVISTQDPGLSFPFPCFLVGLLPP